MGGDRGCNCEGWHQLGASRGGGSDIVEKHLGVVNQLKRSLEPLEDRAECGEMAVDVGLKQEWSELCDWERVGAPFLDGSEGKQRWQRHWRQRRVGSSGCSGEGLRGRRESLQRSTTSTACGTSVKTSHFHQSETDGTSRVPTVPRVGEVVCYPSLQATPPAVNIQLIVLRSNLKGLVEAQWATRPMLMIVRSGQILVMPNHPNPQV